MKRAVVSCAAVIVAGVHACSARKDSEMPVAPPPRVPEAARAMSPLASFERMVGGRWKTTATAGTVTFDTWHWGPSRLSIRSMTEGTAANGAPWRSVGVFYWHPGRKQVLSLRLSPVFRGVSEGTAKFDGEKGEGVFDLNQTVSHRVMGLRWTFDGPDKYTDELLDQGPDGFVVMNAWERFRVAAATEGERASEPVATSSLGNTSEFLEPIERLLGSLWAGEAKQTGAAGLQTSASFEYVPYADAVYGRVMTAGAGGESMHAMDLYLYHHTGARVLRCLALASDDAGRAIVYEGDITPIENGRTLKVDLKRHRADGVASLEAHIEFEENGSVRQRVWLVEGQARTLQLDLRHRATKQLRDGG